MIFFTRTLFDGIQPQSGWEQRAHREWRRNTRTYADYLATITAKLPASVKRLCRNSLHDARVVVARQKPGILTIVLDTSSALSRFRGCCIHLCFHGVKSRVPVDGLAGQSWLYEEAHLCSRSRFSLHALLDKTELEIEADQLVIQRFRRQLTAGVGPQDFRPYPIWEFTDGKAGVDDQNETWIRPVKRKTLAKNAQPKIVATQFTTRAGKELHGFLIVRTADEDVTIESGAIWFRGFQKLRLISRKRAANAGENCSLKDRNDLARALGQKEGDVFPIRYRLNAAILGEKNPLEGQIM